MLLFLPYELIAQIFCFIPLHQLQSCLLLDRKWYQNLFQNENSVFWSLLRIHMNCNSLIVNKVATLSHKKVVLQYFGFITDHYKFEEIIPAYPINELQYLECLTIYRPFHWKENQYKIKHIGLFSASQRQKLQFILQLLHGFQMTTNYQLNSEKILQFPEHLDLLFQSIDHNCPHLMISIWFDKWYPLNWRSCQRLDACIALIGGNQHKNTSNTILTDLIQIKTWKKECLITIVDGQYRKNLHNTCKEYHFDYFTDVSVMNLFVHCFHYFISQPFSSPSCIVQ